VVLKALLDALDDALPAPTFTGGPPQVGQPSDGTLSFDGDVPVKLPKDAVEQVAGDADEFTVVVDVRSSASQDDAEVHLEPCSVTVVVRTRATRTVRARVDCPIRVTARHHGGGRKVVFDLGGSGKVKDRTLGQPATPVVVILPPVDNKPLTARIVDTITSPEMAAEVAAALLAAALGWVQGRRARRRAQPRRWDASREW
jgi:hypothetical protein